MADLHAADLDGDGRDELLAGLGAWGAFDVRVFDVSEAGELTLRARKKLGAVYALTTLHRPGSAPAIAATHRHTSFAAPDHFPPGTPYGAPAGIHVLDSASPGLATTTVQADIQEDVDFPAMDYQTRLFSADLDVDGRPELVEGGEEPLLEVHVQDDAGDLEAWSVRDLVPLAVADLDGDGDDEVVVRTADARADLLVLGTGSGHLDARSLDHPPPASHPEGLRGATRAVWDQAEELFSMGFPDLAAEALSGVALLEADRTAAAHLRARAAQMMAAHQRWAEAGALYAEAAVDHSRPEEMYSEAAESFRKVGALEAERTNRVAGRPASSVAPGLDTLTALLDTPPLTIDFRQRVSDDWHVSGLPTFRRDPSRGGLRVSGPEAGQVMRLPVQRTEASDVVLEVDFTVFEPEWAGGMVVRLVPDTRNQPGVGFTMWNGGGGGSLYQLVTCGVRGDLNVRVPIARVGRTRVRMVWDADAGEMVCDVQVGDAHERTRAPPMRSPAASSAGALWWLELRPFAHNSDQPVSWVAVHAVRALGVVPDPSRVAEPSAARALMNGRAEEAQQLLSAQASTADVQVARFFAAIDRGDSGAAARLLEAALRADPSLGGLLPAVLRLAPTIATPVVRASLGSDWPVAFCRAWTIPIHQDPDQPELQRVLLDHAGGAFDQAGPVRPEVRTARLRVAASRSRALRRSGRWGAAESELRAALLDAEVAPLSVEQSAVVADLWREQARLRTHEGRLDDALSALDRALAVSPAEQVERDTVLVDPDLAPLHVQPGWSARFGASEPGSWKASH